MQAVKAEPVKIRCCGPHPDKAYSAGCGRVMSIFYAYKCLYCGFYFCARCAEKHFGKTRAEHNEEMKAAGKYLGNF
ncbi:hypothetical protein DSOUD_0850 [Desulfuromonas soudanensis]|uniref:Uncharacterized protein n=2 Tax=Desulfuromonas soudanensis TaxID=1603606 RepID=A0A0M4DFT9_9BACT|nr:hypothetical protein DSOUD_0850 [Desulfuromonas soudanensis]